MAHAVRHIEHRSRAKRPPRAGVAVITLHFAGQDMEGFAVGVTAQGTTTPDGVVAIETQ